MTLNDGEDTGLPLQRVCVVSIWAGLVFYCKDSFTAGQLMGWVKAFKMEQRSASCSYLLNYENAIHVYVYCAMKCMSEGVHACRRVDLLRSER